MKIIYLELSGTYREISIILRNYGLDYFLHAETIDHYVEQLVRFEVLRRRCGASLLRMQDCFKQHIAAHPVSNDYFTNRAVQLYLVHSTQLWRTVSDELPFTPHPAFMMWHIERGLWKMITSGVDRHAQRIVLPHS